MPAAPIYRPGERIDGSSADQSALRQYIVRLRGITAVACLHTTISYTRQGANIDKIDVIFVYTGRDSELYIF